MGWTIGGGVEYAVTNNVTIKGEYLYASLGSDHINTVANLIAASEFPLATATARLTYNASIFRAGVNYKFFKPRRFDLNCFSRRRGDFPPAFCVCAAERYGEKPSSKRKCFFHRAAVRSH